MCGGDISRKVTLVTGVTVSVCRWGWYCTAVPGRCPLGNTSEGCPISTPERDSRGGRREEGGRKEGEREGGRRRGEGRREEGGRQGRRDNDASRYPVLSLD